MKKSFLFGMLGIFVSACSDGEGVSIQEEPPEGYPKISGEYHVQMTLDGSDCEPANITPEAASEIKAIVTQNGVEVTWIQSSDAGSWTLNGAVCPSDDQFELRLKGISRVREHSKTEVCEAYVVIPASPAACDELSEEACLSRSSCIWEEEQCKDNSSVNSDVCTADDVLVLAINDTQLSGSAEISMAFKRDCADGITCRFQMTWNAELVEQ